MSVHSKSSWNLEVLIFKEREKQKYPEKNLSELGREPTTNSMHIWCRRQDSNPGHIGRRRVLSPLHYTLAPHPCYQMKKLPLFHQTAQKEDHRGMEALLIRKFSQAGKIFLSLRKYMEISLENSKVLSMLLYHCGLRDPTHLRPKSSMSPHVSHGG